jgi:hypothetical protein
VPLELASDGNGHWTGSRSFVGTTRITYVVQAVDNRGNVTWLEYQANPLPSSGVPPGTAGIIDVPVTLVASTAPSITSAPALARVQGTPASVSPIATVSDPETAAGSLIVTTTSVPLGISVTDIANNAGAVSARVGALCTAALGPNTVGLSVTDGTASTPANLTVNVSANPAPSLGTYPATSLLVGGGTTVSASVAATDNGTIGFTVAAGTFTGTLTVDTAGVVTIADANAGVHTVTVTATDDCGAVTQRTFTLTVTTCGGEVVVVPDGRPVNLTLANGTSYFALATTANRSYTAHVAATTDAASPGALALLADTDACGAGSLPSARDTTALEPALGSGTRLSFVATGTLYRLRATNPGPALPVVLGASETTLFSAAWSTGGTFNTYYSLQNTTSQTVNATIVLTDAAGVEVISQVVNIPAGRTVAVNTAGMGAPRNRTGVARLTHDGPAAAVLATAAIVNLGSTPPYVQPVKFTTARERR